MIYVIRYPQVYAYPSLSVTTVENFLPSSATTHFARDFSFFFDFAYDSCSAFVPIFFLALACGFCLPFGSFFLRFFFGKSVSYICLYLLSRWTRGFLQGNFTIQAVTEQLFVLLKPSCNGPLPSQVPALKRSWAPQMDTTTHTYEGGLPDNNSISKFLFVFGIHLLSP
jgi:hypothetical protein